MPMYALIGPDRTLGHESETVAELFLDLNRTVKALLTFAGAWSHRLP